MAYPLVPVANITANQVYQDGGLIKYTDTGIKEIGNYIYHIDAIDKKGRNMLRLNFSCFVKDAYTFSSNNCEGIWISGIDPSGYCYTGKALTPIVCVYDNGKLLVENRDYTINYKKNKNVGKAIIIVNGKGNYTGKNTTIFDIFSKDIAGSGVYVDDFFVQIGKEVQKPVPQIYYMGTKLKNGKDFIIRYSNVSGIYKQVGKHYATITGIGNYTGVRELELLAVENAVKKKPVGISATIENFSYTGKFRKQSGVAFDDKDEDIMLFENKDYTVYYEHNKRAGRASVTYCGGNGYVRKRRKIFKIVPYNIAHNYDDKIEYENYFDCVYVKGGVKPKPMIAFDGKELVEGIDYTVRYKHNKIVSEHVIQCAVIKGRGCFRGKMPVCVTIKPQDLSKMTLLSCDRIYRARPNQYKIIPKLIDSNGRRLSKGKDYDTCHITYTYENDVLLENGILKKKGDTVGHTDIIPAGTQICIVFGCGKGKNYEGKFCGTYRIVKVNIKYAKVIILDQKYTGQEIIPDKSQIRITLSGVCLESEDYDIIQCINNIEKGKASVIIKGKGNYGGIKITRFNITAKEIW